jgi:3-hydroxybutyryl-CoA dehydrogenase
MGFEKIGVVGCGLMGSGIVETCAAKGYSVVAVKATGGDPQKARARVAKSLDRRVTKGKLSDEERDAILGRIEFTTELSELADCDLVIESAVEDLPAKTKLLREIESQLTNGCILASNTSSLPLDALADRLARPEQFLALHFFNPVPAMKLVELAATERTAPGCIAAARSFVTDLGKTPVEVTATPGYVVNRLLVPYLLHAIETLESGVATPQAIDEAMKLGCGHPMGPLALSDLIGLDVVFAMARALHEELRDQRYRPPSLLRRLVLAGHLGTKAGRGVYDYRGGTVTVNPAIDLGKNMVAAAADAE